MLKKGFTLIEVIISLVIFGIMAVSIYSLSSLIFKTNYQMIDVQGNLYKDVTFFTQIRNFSCDGRNFRLEYNKSTINESDTFLLFSFDQNKNYNRIVFHLNENITINEIEYNYQVVEVDLDDYLLKLIIKDANDLERTIVLRGIYV